MRGAGARTHRPAHRLTRRLVLEERADTPDGKGGFTVNWVALGTLWADVQARSGGEALIGAREQSKLRLRIVTRAAPPGSAHRPRPEQRFREGTRIYTILAVAEQDPAGRWLECWAEEGRE